MKKSRSQLQQDRIAELERMLARAHDALRPFAFAYEAIPVGTYDAQIVATIQINPITTYGLHAGDFRTARDVRTGK